MLKKLTASILAIVFAVVSFHIQDVNAINGGKVYGLGFFNVTSLTTASSIFEEIHVSCFNCPATPVKIVIPQLNLVRIITLDSSVPQGWFYRHNINQDISTATELPPGKVWRSVAVYVSIPLNVTSTIAVHVNKAVPGSGAGYLAIPVTYDPIYLTDRASQLYEYYIASYNSVATSGISVVSLFNNTCVTVYQYNGSNPVSTRHQDATLMASDVLNVYFNSSFGDATGLVVQSRKPVSVFGGIDNAKVPVLVDGTDAIIEQMPKKSLLGTKHIIASIPGRPYTVGFRYRVVGVSSIPTNVTVSEYKYTLANPILVGTNTPQTVERGHFIEGLAGTTTPDYTVVIVDCGTIACLVAQYDVGNSVPPSSAPYYPDPAMVIVCPVNRYTKDISFTTVSINNGAGAEDAANFITVVSTTSATARLKLDGTTISSQWIVVPALTGYSVTFMTLTPGFHTLSTHPNAQSTDFYNAFVFGFGKNVAYPQAYAYMAGFDIPADEVAPLSGPWYDMTDPVLDTTSPPLATTASPPPAVPGKVAGLIPKFETVIVANFTTLFPYPNSKVPDTGCADAYGNFFIYRINALAQNLADPTYTKFKTDNPECAGLNVTVITNVSNTIYFSEYSRSGGMFWIIVSGSGESSLYDVYVCSIAALAWFRDPNNWVPNYDTRSRNFLDKNDKNFPALFKFCAEMFVSNPGGLFIIYRQQWACPYSAVAMGSASQLIGRNQLSVVSVAAALISIAVSFFY